MRDHATDRLCLQIAGLTIAIRADSPELRMGVAGPTRKFLVQETRPEVRVRAAWRDLSRDAADGELLFDSEGAWQLHRVEGRQLFRFVYPALGHRLYKVGVFGPDFKSGEVFLHRPCFAGRRRVYPLDYPLDELLMINLLAAGRGLLVHACGMVDPEGAGHLFVGQSGAGKTTMARLVQRRAGVKILSDDRIILRKQAGRVVMYGTPWHGDARRASPESAPLKQILFLRHRRQHRRVALAPAEVVARLLACSFVPFHNSDGLEFSLEFCRGLANTLPCGELQFVPEKSVFDFVLKEPA